MPAKFSEGSTERIEFSGETITIWRTFEDSGRGRPTRRYHFDVSHRFFSLPPGFESRDAALGEARRCIIGEQDYGLTFDVSQPQARATASARDKRLRERLELVTAENGYCAAEVEMAQRKLKEAGFA